LDGLSRDLKHQIISLDEIIKKFDIFNLYKKENYSISIFNDLSYFKKTILNAVNHIRTKYIKSSIYIELVYDTSKNNLEIKARNKDFNEIISMFNQIFRNFILSNIQLNSFNNELDGSNKNDILIKEDKNYTQFYKYKDKKENSLCQICLENLSDKDIIKLSFCGCIYCKECIKNVILVQINSQPVADLPLKCSICSNIILNQDIFKLFNQNERKFLFYQLTKYYMTKENKNKDFCWCENPHCQFVYKKSQYIQTNSNNIRNCPNCLKTFCLLCSNELRDNIHNQECKMVILKNLDINNRNWIIKNTNNCPKCNQIYEKSDGCNHMICKKCVPEIHFCYICCSILDSKE